MSRTCVPCRKCELVGKFYEENSWSSNYSAVLFYGNN
jgi:hypothetical protein